MRPSRSRGRPTPGWAISAASGGRRARRSRPGRSRLARDREVVDVEHADVDAAAGDQLQRVGPGARRADLRSASAGRVDRCVHGVGNEVQRDHRRGRARRLRDGARRPRGGRAQVSSDRRPSCHHTAALYAMADGLTRSGDIVPPSPRPRAGCGIDSGPDRHRRRAASIPELHFLNPARGRRSLRPGARRDQLRLGLVPTLRAREPTTNAITRRLTGHARARHPVDAPPSCERSSRRGRACP